MWYSWVVYASGSLKPRTHYETLRDTKPWLVAKGFSQREEVDYRETFPLMSMKDSLYTIMTLVANFDLELHQVNVKKDFLNGDLEEKIYLTQLKVFPPMMGFTWFANSRNLYMDWNMNPTNGIQNSIVLSITSLIIDFSKALTLWHFT